MTKRQRLERKNWLGNCGELPVLLMHKACSPRAKAILIVDQRPLSWARSPWRKMQTQINWPWSIRRRMVLVLLLLHRPQTGLGALQPPNFRGAMQFRRTYSSNSIKVRDVEVGPQSFDKIKLIGKGDVGKVYLVREKKSTRLYAMKGMLPIW
jgi:serine/threonine protein kinase